MYGKRCFFFTVVGIISFIYSAELRPQTSRPDALQAYRNGDFRNAIAICQQEIANLPGNLDSYVVISWSYIELKDFDNSLRYGEIAERLSPNDLRIIRIIGESLFGLSRFEQAHRYVQRFMAREAGQQAWLDGYRILGEIYIHFQEYNHADIAFTTAAHYTPRNAYLWNRLGYAKEMAGDLDGALAAYQQSLSLNPRLNDSIRGRDRLSAGNDG